MHKYESEQLARGKNNKITHLLRNIHIAEPPKVAARFIGKRSFTKQLEFRESAP